MKSTPGSIAVMRRSALSLGAAAILGIAMPAQAAGTHHTVVPAGEISWGAAPASLPPGAQAAVLLGSPARQGPFVLRLKLPAGFVIPPHRHTKDESVTVVSGRFQIGAGETIDRAAMQELQQASFVHLPSGMPHYARAEGETIVQINGIGPFDVVYVNPDDDPRKQ